MKADQFITLNKEISPVLISLMNSSFPVGSFYSTKHRFDMEIYRSNYIQLFNELDINKDSPGKKLIFLDVVDFLEQTAIQVKFKDKATILKELSNVLNNGVKFVENIFLWKDFYLFSPLEFIFQIQIVKIKNPIRIIKSKTPFSSEKHFSAWLKVVWAKRTYKPENKIDNKNNPLKNFII